MTYKKRGYIKLLSEEDVRGIYRLRGEDVPYEEIGLKYGLGAESIRRLMIHNLRPDVKHSQEVLDRIHEVGKFASRKKEGKPQPRKRCTPESDASLSAPVRVVKRHMDRYAPQVIDGSSDTALLSSYVTLCKNIREAEEALANMKEDRDSAELLCLEVGFVLEDLEAVKNIRKEKP